MSKTIIRAGVLFIVISLFVLVLIIRRSPFGKNNSEFACAGEDEITLIELSSGKTARLVLEKKGEEWFINGKSEARKSGVMFILRILKEIKIKSPVSPALFESEITRKNIIPVKVRVYSKRKLLKTFLVYKTGSNVYGNIMKMKESSKPFIVYVPGYEGDIGSGFIVNPLYWQTYTVFNLLPSEIASVNFENTADTSSSFTIINRNHKFILSGQGGNQTRWDSALVERYISYFARIPFESWAFDIEGAVKERIETEMPLYRITVVTTPGIRKILTLWGMRENEGDKTIISSDRLLGKTGESDEFFVMRYFDIDPLIKKRSYFFGE
jgi:hypothetical protein